MTRFTRLAILLTVVGCARTAEAPPSESPARTVAGSEPLVPLVDHHKHVVSPTAAALLPEEERHEPRTAEKLVAELDSVGIQRAVVLSVAYWFGSPLGPPVDDEYMKVQTENDWEAREVARFPDRLVGFCSFNPLKDYAIQELERCANNRHLKGLKLHFGNSGVDLRKDEHVERVRAVFAAANQRRYPIVAHLWTLDRTYGREHSEIFLNRILPGAPDIVIQIAHMAGGGRSTDAALAVFADARGARDARTKNLYFDVATLTEGQNENGLRQDVTRMRQIGMDHILWGSDAGSAPKLWGEFRRRMPLSPEELRVISTNIAPYLR